MNLDLHSKKWGKFEIDIEFEVINSKAYHKTQLSETKLNGLAYVSRTNSDFGIESVVNPDKNLKTNPANTISFGAENATFFYQSSKYITGNKMYYLQNKQLSKYSGLFVQLTLNNSIKNCGFGYGKGLTGTRMSKRVVLLPVNSSNRPDYMFMETYMKEKEQVKLNKYNQYASQRLTQLQDYKEVEPLEDKKWDEFFLNEIFTTIQRGRRLKKSDHKKGATPYVSSTAINNGVDGFIGNKDSVRIFSNCLTIANSGSVGATFYQPFRFIASDHVTKLSNNDFNQYIYKFTATIIQRLGIKYSFNREINNTRISREKIILPTNQNKKPDYEYMENYMKRLEFLKLERYLKYKNLED